MSHLSVRGRITAMATALAAVILLLVSVLIVRLVENDVRADVEAALTESLEQQAERLRVAQGPDDRVPDSVLTAGGETQFAVLADGRRYELGLFDELSEGNATGELLVDGQLERLLEIDLRSKQVVAVFEPDGDPVEDPTLLAELQELTFDILDIDGEQGSALLVGAADSLADIEASTAAVRRALTITVPFILIAFAAVAWWLTGRALRPVRAMTERVTAISTTSLDRRVPVPAGRDEVAELAAVMNEMLGRLEAGDERQRQFSADASHELRSPLTTIRAAAESIVLRPDGDRVPRLADDVVAETERMEHLIADLQDLARTEPQQTTHEPVDLAVVAADVVASIPGSEVEVSGSARTTGSEQQLRRLVQNLVENALRHAATTVTVELSADDATAVVAVHDDGPGVPAEDRARVFDRFVRLDEERTRAAGGSGLGLALAKAIVDRHGGVITVDESPLLGGAVFTARFVSRTPPTGLPRARRSP